MGFWNGVFWVLPFTAETYGWDFIFLQWSHKNRHRWQWWIEIQRLVGLSLNSGKKKQGYQVLAFWGKEIRVQGEVVQQGHRLLTKVTPVHIGIYAKQDSCISDPFNGRRMDYLISHLYDKLMLRILRWGSISLGTLTLHWKRYLFVFDKVTGLSWSSWGEDVENQSNVAGSTAWIKKRKSMKGSAWIFQIVGDCC